MFELQYFLIGILQGITEFLPISSSGHLVLFARLTQWEDQGLFTDIAVHFGTLFAVIFYLRKEVFHLICNILKFEILFENFEKNRQSFFSQNYIKLFQTKILSDKIKQKFTSRIL